jgi:site-specific DNA-cytosine methylase
MKILELFCGTKSISKAFVGGGHSAFTIDIEPHFKPDLCVDILKFDISMLPKEWQHPDVIWASPPCTTFSVCTISKHWKNGQCVSSRGFIGLALVMKSIEIIKQLKPKYYFIENPRGMLRNQPFMLEFPRHTATYCQYGEKYQKPTDIWTNAELHLKKCKAGDRCHQFQPRTYKRKVGYGVLELGVQGLNNAEERGKIPHRLALEILKACESNRVPKDNNLERFLR